MKNYGGVRKRVNWQENGVGNRRWVGEKRRRENGKIEVSEEKVS